MPDNIKKPSTKKRSDVTKPTKPRKSKAKAAKPPKPEKVITKAPIVDKEPVAVRPDLSISTTPTNVHKRSPSFISKSGFPKLYAIFALVVLFGTTTFWSILSAKIQLGNSDELVYEFLFRHSQTLKHATLPAQHNFLIKWPIFYLVNLFGATRTSFIVFTVALVLVTIACLVYFIYKIEKRPLVFGTICLAMASVLLIVPTVPYPGGILPVNMAMINTRNIEYIFYIVSVALLISSPKIRSLKFWLAAILLGLLIASDKLFLTLAIGAGGLALFYYALTQYWQLVSLSVRWLVNAVLAGVGAAALLLLIKAAGITKFANQGGVGPYGLVNSLHNFIEGCIYAVLGIFTNLGANPAASATTLRAIPHEIYTNLISVGGFSYIVNFVFMLAAVYIVIRVFFSTKSAKPSASSQKTGISNAQQLSLLLIWTSIAAIGLYALSNHDYVVDARYLGIIFFAVFISVATFARDRIWSSKKVIMVGTVALVSVITGSFYTIHLYNNDKAALQNINNRDSTIAQVLTSNQSSLLVGDYWRVFPTKLDAGNLSVIPLTNCTTPLYELSSTDWQPSLKGHSFAYLLSLDKSLTDYPSCTINQVLAVYGHPNSSTVIAGTLSHPKELLLIYDQGINLHKNKESALKEPATILPVSIADLTDTSCDTPTIMNIVAHEDDDLLFMNPDTMSSIKAGDCIRTVYVTAGNAGAGEFYWLSREKGSEAAYSYMTGASKDWIQKIVELTNSEFVTIANPKGDPSISLIFMYIPDGNLLGQGFQSSDFESLAKLNDGTIKEVHTVDGQSSYTKTQLEAALVTLMHVYQPTEIRTQSTYTGSTSIYHDHSDHNAVGSLVTSAYSQYVAQQYAGIASIPIKYYLGYTVRQFPVNVSGTALQQKEATFLVYAQHDSNVCQTQVQCSDTPTYSGYLARQYQHPN